MSSPSSLFSPLWSITSNIKQKVWLWIGLIHSSIVQHQIPRDQKRSKLLNQRKEILSGEQANQGPLPTAVGNEEALPPQTPSLGREKKMPP